MTRLKKNLLYGTLIVLIPVLCAAGWWFYWPRYRLAQAKKAFAAGDFARAEEILKLVTQQVPDHLPARFLQAQVLRRLKRPAEAQRALWQAIKLGLPEADGRREFALAEAIKQFTPNAERNLQDVLRERPDDVEILQALAEGYAGTNRWLEADRCYTRRLELEPDRLDARLDRGRLRLANASGFSQRTEQAAADFREILRRSPDHFEARLNLAHCLMKDARMAEVKEELLICRQLCPERVEPLHGLAACALEERDWDQAEKLLREALARERGSVFALGLLGDLELHRERFDRAIAAFQEVLSLEPRNSAAHLKLAQALRRMGQPEQAKEQERIYKELRAEDSSSQAGTWLDDHRLHGGGRYGRMSGNPGRNEQFISHGK